MWHGMRKSARSHSPLITDTASKEFEIYPQPPNVLVSGMITEGRGQLPADYSEPGEEIRRWFILTVWMSSIRLQTAAHSLLA